MLEKSDFVSWANEAEHRCAGQRGVHFFVCPHVVPKSDSEFDENLTQVKERSCIAKLAQQNFITF